MHGAPNVRCFGEHPYQWQEQDVKDTSFWTNYSDEPMGTKEKYWLQDDKKHPWLFKKVRVSPGEPLGEDWCECLVHGLAGLIGVPTPCVAPALEGIKRGVLSRSFVRPGQRLQHGNEVIAKVVEHYQTQCKRENPDYTVENVKLALKDVKAPDKYQKFSALTYGQAT